jgi:hypothetical protein
MKPAYESSRPGTEDIMTKFKSSRPWAEDIMAKYESSRPGAEDIMAKIKCVLRRTIQNIMPLILSNYALALDLSKRYAIQCKTRKH